VGDVKEILSLVLQHTGMAGLLLVALLVGTWFVVRAVIGILKDQAQAMPAALRENTEELRAIETKREEHHRDHKESMRDLVRALERRER
jgi:hypothetical protein